MFVALGYCYRRRMRVFFIFSTRCVFSVLIDPLQATATVAVIRVLQICIFVHSTNFNACFCLYVCSGYWRIVWLIFALIHSCFESHMSGYKYCCYVLNSLSTWFQRTCFLCLWLHDLLLLKCCISKIESLLRNNIKQWEF